LNISLQSLQEINEYLLENEDACGKIIKGAYHDDEDLDRKGFMVILLEMLHNLDRYASNSVLGANELIREEQDVFDAMNESVINELEKLSRSIVSNHRLACGKAKKPSENITNLSSKYSDHAEEIIENSEHDQWTTPTKRILLIALGQGFSKDELLGLTRMEVCDKIGRVV
jgi:hypothetical protein